MPAHFIAEEGPFRGLVLNFEEGEDWIIGRDPDEADFVLEDSTVSRKHVRVTKIPEGVYLKNLSRINPTLVNGEAIEDRILLKEGDQIQIGGSLFLFSEEEIPRLDKPSPKEKKKKGKGGYDELFGDLDGEEPTGQKQPIARAEKQRTEEPPNAYDTIFEDEEGDEVPFHFVPETPYILKVVSGPNGGAEIGLEKGKTYLIGKDPSSCDIVFQDLSVSRQHARLHVRLEGGVEIEDLGSKNGTVVNGRSITGQATIEPQDRVALGTTVFLVIDREAPQETIYSPILPSYEPLKEIEELSLAAKEETPHGEPEWKKKKIPTRHLLIASSFAAVFFIVFLSFFSLFKSESVELAKQAPTAEIEKALKGFPGVQFSYNPAGGKLFLVGNVLTAVQYQEMRFNLEQIPWLSSIEDTVIIDDGISKMMNDLFAINEGWRSVAIFSQEPGKFILSGYVPTNAEAQKLADFVLINFPYTDKLQNRIVVTENLTAQVIALLGSRGFGSLGYQFNQGEVVLSGPYNPSMQEELDKVIKQLKGMAGVQGVQNYTVPLEGTASGLNLSDQFQVSGSSFFDGKGYSVVLNEKLYTVGDFVEGMKIVSIESNAILLEKDGLKYTINYTR